MSSTRQYPCGTARGPQQARFWLVGVEAPSAVDFLITQRARVPPGGVPFVSIRRLAISHVSPFWFEIDGDSGFSITQLLNYPITQSGPQYPPPTCHNDHNVYWVFEGCITKGSQFLLDLSDAMCMKLNIHAASSDTNPAISATIRASSPNSKGLSGFCFNAFRITRLPDQPDHAIPKRVNPKSKGLTRFNHESTHGLTQVNPEPTHGLDHSTPGLADQP